jgi:hypothetical protein
MQVFVSYPSEHLEKALEIKNFIKEIGVDCWFDKDKLVAGEDWDRARKEALKSSDLFVLVCAKQINERDGVYHREINEALNISLKKRLGSIYIIPFRIEKVDLPPEISRFQYINHWESDWKFKISQSFLRAAEKTSQRHRFVKIKVLPE